MKAASLHVDNTVEVSVEEGRIVIVRIQEKDYSLDSLLTDVTDENIHQAMSFGEPVGKEIL